MCSCWTRKVARPCACRGCWRRCRRVRCCAWASSSFTSTSRAGHPAHRRRPHLCGRAAIDQSAQDTDSPVADWFFSQTEFVIRNGTVRWTDELRGAVPLMLSQVDSSCATAAAATIAARCHAAAGLGRSLHLVGRFRRPLLAGTPGRWQDWQGQLYAELRAGGDRPNLPQLQPGRRGRPARGRGALRAWADVSKGQFTGGTADVALVDAAARLGAALEPLAFLALTGRIGARVAGGGFEFETEGLQFHTRDGLHWPGGNVLFCTAAQGRAPARGEMRADRLDLAADRPDREAPAAGHATHALIAASAQGTGRDRAGALAGRDGPARNLRASREGPGLDVGRHMQSAGGAEQRRASRRPPATAGRARRHAGLRPEPGRRQRAAGDRARGLELPGVFEDPLIPVETLAADAQWQVNGDSIERAAS